MSGTDLIGEEFKRKRQKIHDFLTRPTHKGGILLVTGQRGLGKTRLVEEALSQPCGSFWPVRQISQIFGGVRKRKRQSIKREPRQLIRVLLKVDIDPLFPHVGKDSEEAVSLMRNIVCGLTSVIDSRRSLRRYGKTLRERLGFWGYWFGHGLLWPAGCLWAGVWLITGIAIYCAVQCQLLTAFGLRNLGDDKLAHLEFYLVMLIDLAGLILGLIFLRWWDWRALEHMSERLYDLVHAKQVQHDHENSRETKTDYRLNLSLLFTLAILSGLLFWMGQEEIDYLASHLPKRLEAIGKALPNLLDLTKVLLPLLTLASFIAVWTSKSSQKDHAEFDQSNPAWMVNLLRRYLFLCHRCGLEPVLVLDELDKLEELDDFYNQKVPNIDSTGHGMPVWPSPRPKDKLISFLTALALLKASLGAEFLWILIGGHRIYRYLQQDRHERDDGNLGLLATVIHQEIVLGPLGLRDTWQYLASEFNKLPAEPHRPLFKKARYRFALMAWLRTRGNFSTLTREAEDMAGDSRWRELPINPLAVRLAKTVRNLWEPEVIAEGLDFKSQLEFRDKVHEEWVIAWIRSGMLDMANRFLKSQTHHDYFFTDFGKAVEERLERKPKKGESYEILAILTGDPGLLRWVGAGLLYGDLVQQGYIQPNADAMGVQVPIRFQNIPPLKSAKAPTPIPPDEHPHQEPPAPKLRFKAIKEALIKSFDKLRTNGR